MSKAEATRARQKQLSRLLLTLRDFQLALSAITFLGEEADWDTPYNYVERRRLQCFETAFIIGYARPFSQARGKAPPFAWKQISLSLTHSELKLHDRLIFMRNKVTAHSDSEHVEIRPTVLSIQSDAQPNLLMLGPVRFRDGLSLTYEDCCTAESLLHRAMRRLHDKIEELRGEDPARFATIEIDLRNRS